MLARYLLAVPGGMLAALALRRRALTLSRTGNPTVARFYWGAAWGFGLYGLTQLVVFPVPIFPATWLNAISFWAYTGIPVQALRSGLAVWITFNLILSIRLFLLKLKNLFYVHYCFMKYNKSSENKGEKDQGLFRSIMME